MLKNCCRLRRRAHGYWSGGCADDSSYAFGCVFVPWFGELRELRKLCEREGKVAPGDVLIAAITKELYTVGSAGRGGRRQRNTRYSHHPLSHTGHDRRHSPWLNVCGAASLTAPSFRIPCTYIARLPITQLPITRRARTPPENKVFNIFFFVGCRSITTCSWAPSNQWVRNQTEDVIGFSVATRRNA